MDLLIHVDCHRAEPEEVEKLLRHVADQEVAGRGALGFKMETPVHVRLQYVFPPISVSSASLLSSTRDVYGSLC